MTTNFFHPPLLLLFLDPESEIRDPGWVKIRMGINILHPQQCFCYQIIIANSTRISFPVLERIINYPIRYIPYVAGTWYPIIENEPA
jgi:hypothetical protein